MSRLNDLRQVIDPESNSGCRNMAVDEVLLESAIDDGIATLRWYAWREPTVSLGYFQKEDDILQDERLRNLPRVRRLTGGGTLVHDKELTYSLSLPGSQRVIEKPIDLYRLVHQAFIDVFHRRGIEAYLRGHTHRLTQEPVLCFVREDEHDIVVNGHKVLGSAQRRRRGAILQHGGLLLKASAVTPELLGIADLCPTADLSNLMDELNESVSNCLSAAFRRGSLTLSEEEAVETLIGVTQRQ